MLPKWDKSQCMISMEYLLGGLRFIMRETWIIASFELFYEIYMYTLCVWYIFQIHILKQTGIIQIEILTHCTPLRYWNTLHWCQWCHVAVYIPPTNPSSIPSSPSCIPCNCLIWGVWVYLFIESQSKNESKSFKGRFSTHQAK